jgi:hypothetical protein
MISYQQRCMRCKKKMVLVTSRKQFPICYECQKNDLKGSIKDPEMKKMFDIPEELYEKSGFLRAIKIAYLRYGQLTENQIMYFKKAVSEMKEEGKKEKA